MELRISMTDVRCMGKNALAGVHTANNGGVVGAVARSCSAMPCLGHGPQRAVSAVFRVTVLHLVAFFCMLRCLFAQPVRGIFWGFYFALRLINLAGSLTASLLGSCMSGAGWGEPLIFLLYRRAIAGTEQQGEDRESDHQSAVNTG